MSESEPSSQNGSGAGAAVAVVRAYYEAINDRDYRRAYGYWEDAGQTFEAFRNGFAETSVVTVDLGEPGRIEGAAGSRYVDVPASVYAVTVDGRRQAFRGSYVLRRSSVPGASAEQRTWRIYSGEVVEVEPDSER